MPSKIELPKSQQGFDEQIFIAYNYRMTIYNFYLFNKQGSCACYKEWTRQKEVAMSKDEEFRLMYGMLLSLRSFSSKLNTKSGEQQVKSYMTNQYKMNYLEVASGLKMVLNTDLHATGIDDLMRTIYQLYVDVIIKNPLVNPTNLTSSKVFEGKLSQLIEKHSSFSL